MTSRESVEATPAVAALVGQDEPTAWISASVKYPARMVVGGPGLRLGLESGYLGGVAGPWTRCGPRAAACGC